MCRLSVYMSMARWNGEWEQKWTIAQDSRWQSRLTPDHPASVLRFWLWPVMSAFLWIPLWGWCLRSATSAPPPLPLCPEQVFLTLQEKWNLKKTLTWNDFLSLLLFLSILKIHCVWTVWRWSRTPLKFLHPYHIVTLFCVYFHLYTSSNQVSGIIESFYFMPSFYFNMQRNLCCLNYCCGEDLFLPL